MLEQKCVMLLPPNCYNKGVSRTKSNKEDNSRNRYVLPQGTLAVDFFAQIFDLSLVSSDRFIHMHV